MDQLVRFYIGKQRTPGSWPITIDWGVVSEVDPDTGKVRRYRKRDHHTHRGTKREAAAKAAEIVAAINRDEYVEPNKMSFGEWLVKWFNMLKNSKKKRSVRTIETYDADIRKHILPGLGTIPLQRLKPTDIQDYYNSLPLAESTKERHHSIISSALKAAERMNFVLRNVAALVPEKPSKTRGDRAQEAILHCWTKSEAQTFLATLADEPLQTRLFYTLALELGMRKGELCGLKWEDFDPVEGSITVARTLLKPGKEPVFGPPKNKLPRILNLDPLTVKLLQKHKAQQNELKMRNRTVYNDLGLIFAKTWEDLHLKRYFLGDPLQLNNLGQREYAKLIEKAGVRKIKFHGLRHTFATLALAEGIPPHVVQKMLGHKRIEETLNTYSHVLPYMKKEAAAKVASLLRK